MVERPCVAPPMSDRQNFPIEITTVETSCKQPPS